MYARRICFEFESPWINNKYIKYKHFSVYVYTYTDRGIFRGVGQRGHLPPPLPDFEGQMPHSRILKQGEKKENKKGRKREKDG